jgi:hypothetical protein
MKTAVEWLFDYLNNIKELPFIRQNLNINEQNILNDIIQHAKEMEAKQAQEYVEFSIKCDRKDNKILNFHGYINLETFKSE